MTYRHTWSVARELDPFAWEQFTKDCKKLFTHCEVIGLDLCGANGRGNPTVSNHAVIFNGNATCEHVVRNLGQVWPTEEAAGIATIVERGGVYIDDQGVTAEGLKHPGVALAQDSDTEGIWIGGVRVNSRTCSGDCSHEPFVLLQHYRGDTTRRQQGGVVFDTCMTSFKPYDIAVTAVLLLARYHFKEHITITTHGLPQQWADAHLIILQLFPNYRTLEVACKTP